MSREASKAKGRLLAPSGIRFHFDERKTAAAAAHLLARAKGRLPYMKLIKLMYLADRESLREYSRPITGDKYFAMKLGPVLSETLNLIKCESPAAGPWAETIERDGYDVVLKKRAPDEGPLSDAEVELLDRAWDLYSHLDKWALSKYTHKALPEWKDPGKSRREITPERILEIVGKSAEEIDEVRQGATEHAYFDRLFLA